MPRRACVLVLLAICARGVDAKFKNYGRVVESPEIEELFGLFAPKRMLANHNDTSAGVGASLNSSCRRELHTLVEAIARREKWALAMLDASSKPPSSGLLRGNLVDLGQYDECSAVRSGSSDNGIRGLYCTYSISVSHEDITLPVDPSLTVCVPASCSAGDIVAFFNATTSSRIHKLTDLKVKMVSAVCSESDRPVWNPAVVVCLIILASLVAFLIACTAIEMSHKGPDASDSRHPLAETLAMFSLRKSAASILSLEVKRGQISAIDGLRCLSMMGIIFYHHFTLFMSGAMVNLFDYIEWNLNWRSWYAYGGTFGVETFFAVSGFLTAYLFLKQMPKQKNFNVGTYYLHRYLRLTPAVLALMVFAVVFIPIFGFRWHAVLHQQLASCQTKWWPAFLYLQNFVDKENYCLYHMWYLAVDMQLFWISPLILLPLHKKPKFGLALLAALLVISSAVSAVIIAMKRLHFTSHYFEPDTTILRDVLQDVYPISYHRAGPWLIGIFLGYEVATNDRKLSRRSIAAGWSIAVASCAFCLFGKMTFFDPDYEYDVVWETFFSVVSRPVWAIAVCWIIYACINNQAGILSDILSFRVYQPFSKLSYRIYLVHPVVLIVDSAALKIPWHFSEHYVLRSSFNLLMISTAIAFLIHLLFESPILVLNKIMKSKKNHTKKATHSEHEKPEPKQVSTEISMSDHPIAEPAIGDC